MRLDAFLAIVAFLLFEATLSIADPGTCDCIEGFAASDPSIWTDSSILSICSVISTDKCNDGYKCICSTQGFVRQTEYIECNQDSSCEPVCSSDSDCDSGCCAGALDEPHCLVDDDMELAKGESCQTNDGCDCADGLDCDNGTCGKECTADSHCESGCCGSQHSPSVCLVPEGKGEGEQCYTKDGCDCEDGLGCIDGMCLKECSVDTDCKDSGCCLSQYSPSVCLADGVKGPGEECYTKDGCDCKDGVCEDGLCPATTPAPLATTPAPSAPTPTTPTPTTPTTPTPTTPTTPTPTTPTAPSPTPVCPPGSMMCGDPHMQGLSGQKIDWSGIDGGWYSLIRDDQASLHVNVRLTAPLPDKFPNRQLITGLSVMSEGHSLVIEVKNPYDVRTDGCPHGVSPCLAKGGLRAVVDGKHVDDVLRFSRNVDVADGITVSASNLPVECRQFGGDMIWARMYEEMLMGVRELTMSEPLEDWILRFDHMAAPDWCTKYIAENDLADLQSTHAVFKIETPTVTVRLNVGVNYQTLGEVDWDGRVLPNLTFWQMDVGLDGLSRENPSLSGILGETARPVYDENGQAAMEGFDAFRGNVEDYRVSGSLGIHFALLDEK